MSETWQRLTPQAQERVDEVLVAEGLLKAIVLIRNESGLDPAPDLKEAHDTVKERRRWLIDNGRLDEWDGGES